MICIKISDCTQLETEAIMQNKYQQKYTEIFQQIGDHAKLVLATSLNNKVSARTMRFVILEGSLYFQTDKEMRKYQDIKGNPNVALCFSNIQLEGICEEIGRPIEHEDFCRLFQQHFPSSFEAYSQLPNERLFVVRPTFIQRWSYINGSPMIERLYLHEKQYHEEVYLNDD